MQEVASSAEHIRSSSNDMAEESEQTTRFSVRCLSIIKVTDRINDRFAK